MRNRVENEQAAFAFDERRRDHRAVRMDIAPVATERVFAEATFCLVGRFSGRETGSMITPEAVLPEAVAAEAVTPEAQPEEAMLPEAMTAKAAVPEAVPEKTSFCEAVTAEAAVPEAVAALKMAAPESAMISEADFRESLGRGRLEVVANRRRRRQRRVAERNRLGRRRLQDSQDAKEEAQGQTHRAEYSGDRHGGLRGERFLLRHGHFLSSPSASRLLATVA